MGGLPVVIASQGTPVCPVSSGAPLMTVAANGKGIPVVLSDRGVPCVVEGYYDASASALFARFTARPTVARKALINTMITSLKTAGVWSKLDCLYMMAAHDVQAAQRNWVQDLYNLTPVNTPTFVADDYYRSVSTTSRYMNTGFNPSTAVTPKFALTDAHFGAWGLLDTTAATEAIMGAQTSTTVARAMIIPHAGSGVSTANFRINENTTTTLVSNSGNGDWIVRRTGTTRSVLQNSASLGAQTNAATAVPTFSFFLGGINNGGVLGNAMSQNYVAASIGGYLTDAEEAAFHTAKQTYLTAIGAI